VARILLAAHDKGGANCLAAVQGLLAERGHQVQAVAQGPAQAILAGAADTLAAAGPADLIVTGTSYRSELERAAWGLARARAIPALAVIDSFVDAIHRFIPDDGRPALWPDAVSLVDPGEEGAMRAVCPAAMKIFITGQAHLEGAGAWLADLRATLQPAGHAVTFYSEPIAQACKGPDHPGFDQYLVADLLLAALGGQSLAVMIHPSEDPAPWALRAAGRPRLTAGFAEGPRTLASARLVAGISTMALFEAAAAGIPFLALQPFRRFGLNRAIDLLAGGQLITDPATLPAGLRAACAAGPGLPASLAPAISGARARLVSLIETMAGTKESHP